MREVARAARETGRRRGLSLPPVASDGDGEDRGPGLDAVQVRPDGSLEGFDGIGRPQGAEAGIVVVAHLLALLVTFIGEPLTMRLVSDAWPGGLVAGTDAGSEEQS